MEINLEKSKAMIVGRNDEEEVITSNDVTLQFEDTYEYFGMMINKDEKGDIEVLNRVKKVNVVYS